MRVLIVGCGRVGSRLAIEMSREHDVTIVDSNPNAFVRIADAPDVNAMIGNGIDEDMLRRAGVEQADAFIAVTNGDNRNIMAAQIAKHIFHVQQVVCRIYDPVRSDVYSDLGLSTYCPTVDGSQKIKRLIGCT